MFKEPAQNTTQNNQWYESKTRNIFNSRIQNRMFCFSLHTPAGLLALVDKSPWFHRRNARYNQSLSISVVILYSLQFLELECT